MLFGVDIHTRANRCKLVDLQGLSREIDLDSHGKSLVCVDVQDEVQLRGEVRREGPSWGKEKSSGGGEALHEGMYSLRSTSFECSPRAIAQIFLVCPREVLLRSNRHLIVAPC